MIYEGKIEGRLVNLRSATEEDAQVTLTMRLNKEKTRFLHPVDNDVVKQRNWIRKQRETLGDYFFVVEDKNDNPIGMMGIYEIENDRGHSGRLLMYGNALQSYEAYLLLFRFGFDILGLKELFGDTDINNISAIKFSKAYGFQYNEPIYDAEMNRNVCWGTLSLNDFLRHASEIEKMIYR